MCDQIIKLAIKSTPFIPIIFYSILCVFTIKRHKQKIPDKKYNDLNNRMNSNLSLVGFSFAVIGLLISLFQADLAKVSDAIYFFSASLSSFFCSYILLYLRVNRFFDCYSAGMTNNGLWATMIGLYVLFEAFPILQQISWLFIFLTILVFTYIIIDIRFKWADRNLES